jgi:CBS domain-containing protein
MDSANVGAIPVLSADRELIGMVTDRDIAIRVAAKGLEPTIPVNQVMSRKLVFCRYAEEASIAIELMAQQKIRRMPIVDDDGRLVGIISQADVARKLGVEAIANLVARISNGQNAAELVYDHVLAE